MTTVFNYRLDWEFLNDLINKYNLDLNNDSIISTSNSESELISNFIYEAIWEINSEFLKLASEYLPEKTIDNLTEKLQDLIFINSLDSHNQLDVAVEEILTKTELKKLSDNNLNYSFYSF
jgi:transcription initiation factor IIF auxiliary subunit